MKKKIQCEQIARFAGLLLRLCLAQNCGLNLGLQIGLQNYFNNFLVWRKTKSEAGIEVGAGVKAQKKAQKFATVEVPLLLVKEPYKLLVGLYLLVEGKF